MAKPEIGDRVVLSDKQEGIITEAAEFDSIICVDVAGRNVWTDNSFVVKNYTDEWRQALDVSQIQE
jgi:hypothetical protein